MASLEERVAALEAVLATRGPTGPAPGEDDFWLLNEINARHPEGAVAFGGTAKVGLGEVAWQWGVGSDQLAERDWAPAAAVLGALAHPVRLLLLQRVLNGVTGTSELADDPTLGTTGQLHHHLRALVAAGWLSSAGRGRWMIPPPRVIPLLVVISAVTA